MTKKWQRGFCLILALLLCIGLLPVPALAGNPNGPKPKIKNVTYTNETPPRVKVEFTNGEGKQWIEIYAVKKWQEGDTEGIGKIKVDDTMYRIVGIQSIDPDMEGVYQTTAGTTVVDCELYLGDGDKPAVGTTVGIVVETGDESGFGTSSVFEVVVPGEGKSVTVGESTGGTPIVCDHTGCEPIYSNAGASGHNVKCSRCGKTIRRNDPHDLTYTKDSSHHRGTCTLCGYTFKEPHDLVFTNENAETHDERCVKCLYSADNLKHYPDGNGYRPHDEEKHFFLCPCGVGLQEDHKIDEGAWTYRDADFHVQTCADCKTELTHTHRYYWKNREYSEVKLLGVFPKPHFQLTYKVKCTDCTAIREATTHYFCKPSELFATREFLQALVNGRVPQDWLTDHSKGSNDNSFKGLVANGGMLLMNLFGSVPGGSNLEFTAKNIIDTECLAKYYDGDPCYKVFNGAGQEVGQKTLRRAFRSGGSDEYTYNGWSDPYDEDTWSGPISGDNEELCFVLNGNLINDLSDGWHTYSVILEGHDPEDPEAEGTLDVWTMKFRVATEDGSKVIAQVVYPGDNDISDMDVTLKKEQWSNEEAVYIYSGQECEPKATVTYCGRQLYEGTDYTLSYENNVNAGTAYAVLTATGDTFTGTVRVPFTIQEMDLNDLYSTNVPSVIYNAKPQTPKPDLYLGSFETLQEGIDYEIVGYRNNLNAGTGTVTVRGKGNFIGERTLNFTIKPMPLTENDLVFSYPGAMLYTGAPLKPDVSIRWKMTGEFLVEGRDYELVFNDATSYENNIDVGSCYMLIRGIGNFAYDLYRYIEIVAPDAAAPPVNVQSYKNMVWSIDGEGTLFVDCTYCGGVIPDLSYYNDVAWRPYRTFIKKIVVTNTRVIPSGSFADCKLATEPGCEDYITCAKCGADTYKAIPALGHDWSQPVYTWSADDSKVTATAVCRNDPSHITTETVDTASGVTLRPTCTDSGMTTYTATFEDPMFETQTKTLKNVSPVAHKYKDEITPPACTEGGYTTHTCIYCGDTFTDSETAPLRHDFGQWTETTPATCTEKGEETRTCSRCSATERRDTDALGHDLIHHDARPATCTEAGWNAYDACSRCDFTTFAEIPPVSHTWAKEYTVDKAATTAAEGQKSIHCTVCNAIKPGSEVKIDKITAPAVDLAKEFSDISKKAWYYSAVSYAVNNKLFEGSNGKFDPDGDMTRGMFVSVLARLAGVKVNNKVTTKFSDVKKGQWYTGAVKWASDNGIVTGSNGKFMPNDPITREQICTIFVTYAKYKKITLTPKKPAVTFKDAKKISKWAKAAVTTCQRAGLVEGSNGNFDPQGKATRAAVAQIIMNFDKNFG